MGLRDIWDIIPVDRLGGFLVYYGRKAGLDEGRKAGLDEGRKVGLDEGRKEGHRDIAITLLGMNMPIDEIATITGLPKAEIMELKKEQ